MEFYSFSDLTAEQFVGRDDGPLEQQKQNHVATYVEEIAHFF